MNQNRSTRRKLLPLMLTFLTVFSWIFSVGAAEPEEAYIASREGVVQIQFWYIDPETEETVHLCNGIGFLINNNTVISCQHTVSDFSDDWYTEQAKYAGEQLSCELSASDIKENLQIRVCALHDIYISASVRHASAEMDYAILTLDENLYNYTPLTLRRGSTLMQSETVYALGYPSGFEDGSSKLPESDEVTVTSGTFLVLGSISYSVEGGGTYSCDSGIAHSAQLTSGSIGGPLVDSNGAVVGINAAVTDTNEVLNLAVSSDQLIDALDAFGIQYEEAASQTASDPSSTEPEETATVGTEAVSTEESATDEPAITEIESTEVSMPDAIDEPQQSVPQVQSEPVTLLLFPVVLAVIVLIVIILLLRKKKQTKKKEPKIVPATNLVAVNGASENNRDSAGFAPAPMSVPASGPCPTEKQQDCVTTILNKSIYGGTLHRVSTGEKIKIDAETFIIGRERKKVNYCITDNPSISRNHAKIIIRNGNAYLVDLKAKNGTLINNMPIMPNQEVELKNGDKFTLADEVFEFTV